MIDTYHRHYESEFDIVLPASKNEQGTPVSKMPNCPNCKEDELGMLTPDLAYCYCCGLSIVRGSNKQGA